MCVATEAGGIYGILVDTLEPCYTDLVAGMADMLLGAVVTVMVALGLM